MGGLRSSCDVLCLAVKGCSREDGMFVVQMIFCLRFFINMNLSVVLICGPFLLVCSTSTLLSLASSGCPFSKKC